MRSRRTGGRKVSAGLAVAVAVALAVVTGSQAAGSGVPVVSAGVDQTVTVADPAALQGTVSDDGLPAGLSDLRWTWSQVSGPAPATFDDNRDLIGVVSFTAPGSYTLRLTVTDGSLSASDDVVVTVLATHATVLRVPQDYPTIQGAIDAAPPRSLVLVSPGTYVETVTIAKTVTLASTYYTIGDRSLIDRTTIQAPSVSAETVVVTSAAGPETQVIGFRITTGRNGILVSGATKVIGNHVVGIETDAVEYKRDAVGLVQDNVLESSGDDGIDLNYSHAVVRDNLIRQNNGDGIEFRIVDRLSAVSNSVFRGNHITANRRDGIQLIDEDTTVPTATKIVIERNLIESNELVGLGLMDGAVSSEDFRGASLLERIVVGSNTFVGNAYGITGGDNMTAVNNIFAGNTTAALRRVDGGSLATYNIFWANGLVSDGSNLDAAHALLADPLLDGSYRLQAGSPAIDAGIASLVLSGELVVDIPPGQYTGAAPDLGRYETTGTGGNAAPVVYAGPDQSVVLPAGATLVGTVSDDGLPNPPGATTAQWTQVGGPGSAVFESATSTTSAVTFPVAGSYTLRLTASDSQLSASDDVVVTVADGSSGGTGTVNVRVAAGSDDAEQAASGGVSVTSSDLELVYDGSNQLVGLRFAAVDIPQGAIITHTYVQFQADESQSETTSLTIRGQAHDGAPAFTSSSGNISARTPTASSVVWSPPAWLTTGAAGADQRTPDLSVVINEIVARPGWASGNALVIMISGTGHRTAESFEGMPTGAPLLHAEYSSDPPVNRPPVAGDDAATTGIGTPVTIPVAGNDTDPDGNLVADSINTACNGCSAPLNGTLALAGGGSFTYTPSAGFSGSDGFVYEICDAAALCDTAAVTITVAAATRRTLDVRIAAGSDDAEESSSTSVSLTSSDLELVVDGTKVQVVGLRFAGLGIPRGSVIESAYVQFQADAMKTGPAALAVRAQAADNAVTFTTTKRNVSTRPLTTASVTWTPPAWSVVGAAGADQRTPDLRALVQEVVARAGWQQGNAIVFIVTGTGTRTAVSYNKSAAAAPLLHVEYSAP